MDYVIQQATALGILAQGDEQNDMVCMTASVMEGFVDSKINLH